MDGRITRSIHPIEMLGNAYEYAVESVTETVGNLKNFSTQLKSEGPDLFGNLNRATKPESVGDRLTETTTGH